MLYTALVTLVEGDWVGATLASLPNRSLEDIRQGDHACRSFRRRKTVCVGGVPAVCPRAKSTTDWALCRFEVPPRSTRSASASVADSYLQTWNHRLVRRAGREPAFFRPQGQHPSA